MMSAVRTLTAEDVRRLIITRQHLSADARAETMLDIIRDLGCLQLDPISAVEKSHLLVLWSRLGDYDRGELDRLLWEERSLFEYWAHEASIVLTEDYPLHAARMRAYPLMRRRRDYINKWLDDNPGLRGLMQHILERLKQEGPLGSRDFDEPEASRGGAPSGWTGNRAVIRLIDYLWHRGEIMVAGRQGNQRLWHVAEDCLPDWTPRDELAEDEVTRQAAIRAIRALGVARSVQIRRHFIRRRYPNLERVLDDLESAGEIERVKVKTDAGDTLRGPWYMHAEDTVLLERIRAGEWTPRTTLLSPFDNLICDRDRTEEFFNFFFRIEIYVPKAKREYGYYVLPVLHGDRLIGRIDPTMDRKRGVLTINAVYAEPDAPTDADSVRAVGESISSLARFLGADKVDYAGKMPRGWGALRRV